MPVFLTASWLQKWECENVPSFLSQMVHFWGKLFLRKMRQFPMPQSYTGVKKTANILYNLYGTTAP